MITGKYKPEQLYKRSTPSGLLTLMTNNDIHYFINIKYVSFVDHDINLT